MSRTKVGFTALILALLAHSIEEYAGKLWESFPPAGFVTGLVSSDRKLGFVVISSALIAFGFWCALFPVRQEWRSARAVVGTWALLLALNGLGHLAWTVWRGGYTPGVLTAPLLVAIAVYTVSVEPTSR